MANKIKNILVTDFEDSGNVIIFTETLTVEKVEEKLLAAGSKFQEIYEVPKSDLQYYIYEPCWMEV